MEISLDLLLNAIVAGMLLGGFYAAVTVGVAISFGMLDIGNIAHPAFIILGSFTAYIVNFVFRHRPDRHRDRHDRRCSSCSGWRSTSSITVAFERRGEEAMRGLAFFFGLLFITEVALILIFGVDYRFVEARYIGPSLHIGHGRSAAAHAGAVRRLADRWSRLLQLYLSRTFIGRAILAVSQDGLALQLMAASPTQDQADRLRASRSRRRRSPARS